MSDFTLNWLYNPVFTEDWNPVPLYDIAKWTNGLAFRDVHFSHVGKPIIKIAEIKNGITDQTGLTEQTFGEEIFVMAGDMLFSWSGSPDTSIDVCWWHGRDGWLNQHIFKVEPNQGVDRTFLYYILKYLKPQFIQIAKNKQTTGLGHVTIKDLKAITVAYPPYSQQCAIARVLGFLDDKIELNRRISETLESIVRALFQSWFVDFDPVRARMEGRPPFGIDAETAALFPDRLVASPLGEIPSGWVHRVWGDLVTLQYGKGLKDYNTYYTGQYPVYGTNGRIGTCDNPLWDRPGIIVGRKGAYRGIHFSNTPFFVIDTAFYVRPSVDMSTRWAYYEMARIDLNSMDSGSAIPSTSRDDFYRLPTIFPSVPVQKRWTELLDPLWKKQEQNIAENYTLEKLRDSLLPKIMSGEIRVYDAEKVLESAL